MMLDKGYREQAQFYCNTVEQNHVDGTTVHPVNYTKNDEEKFHHPESEVSVKELEWTVIAIVIKE